MKKNLLLLFQLIIISIQINAQEESAVISGHVYDLQTTIPLEGVNIFISGTMIGTSTNKDGFFEIKNVPVGIHELVVSIIGFEPETERVKVSENKRLELIYKLKEKPYILDSISVVSKRPEEWFENLEEFKKAFLGKNEFADESTIENEVEINLEVDNQGYLTAQCDNPIIVINRALGYKINIVLQNFRYKEDEGEINYTIKLLFTDYIDSSRYTPEEIRENRHDAYIGSPQHFLKCLVNKKLSEDNYSISFQSRPYSKYYYKNTIKLEDFITDLGNGYYKLYFERYLKVSHDYGKQVSWIKLIQPFLIVDPQGYPQQVPSFAMAGEWAKFGVSKLLPRYVDFEGADK